MTQEDTWLMAEEIWDKELIDAVARCLAKHGQFIDACEWKAEKGDKYRDCAVNVLTTIENFHNGIQSGGLPN